MSEQHRPGSALKSVLPPIPSVAGRAGQPQEATSTGTLPADNQLTDIPRELYQTWERIRLESDNPYANSKSIHRDLNLLASHTYSKYTVDYRARVGLALLDNGLCELITKYWSLLAVSRPEDWNKLNTEAQLACKTLQLLFAATLNVTDTGDTRIISTMNARLMGFMLGLLRSDALASSVGSKLQQTIISYLVGIVYNCVHKLDDTRDLVRNSGGVSIFQMYAKSGTVSIKTDAIVVLSYIIAETEQTELLAATHDNIAYILKILEDCARNSQDGYSSRKYGYSAEEILDGVNRMALADSNKEQIVSCGAIPLYAGFLTSDTGNLARLACQGLWTLAFNDLNKKKIMASQACMQGLQKLASSTSEAVAKAAKSALWVIEGQEKRVQSIAVAPSLTAGGKGKHLMLSYNWGIKPQVIKVKDKLKAAGYKVWIDVEQMTGSTLESMSQAIEEAELVLIFFTEKYKLSDSCRLEAEYTFKLGKKFIPIRMEQGYKPDGWLGILLGARLFFDFAKEGQWDHAFHTLCNEINRLLHLATPENSESALMTTTVLPVHEKLQGQQQQHQHPQPSSIVSPVELTTSLQCRKWTTVDVQRWLAEAGLESCRQRLAKFEGRHIAELRHLLHEVPELFYGKMNEPPFGLDFFELLSLAGAVRELT